MGLMTCTFPEHDKPLELLREFEKTMTPLKVDTDATDVFSASIAKIESALDAGGQKKDEFRPLPSIKRNAKTYAPQYRFDLRNDKSVVMKGAINRCILSLTWDDPIPQSILTKVLQFAKRIPAAEVEAEDDAGNSIDIKSSAPVGS